jgi:hypothetical protein
MTANEIGEYQRRQTSQRLSALPIVRQSAEQQAYSAGIDLFFSEYFAPLPEIIPLQSCVSKNRVSKILDTQILDTFFPDTKFFSQF